MPASLSWLMAWEGVFKHAFLISVLISLPFLSHLPLRLAGGSCLWIWWYLHLLLNPLHRCFPALGLRRGEVVSDLGRVRGRKNEMRFPPLSKFIRAYLFAWERPKIHVLLWTGSYVCKGIPRFFPLSCGVKNISRCPGINLLSQQIVTGLLFSR